MLARLWAVRVALLGLWKGRGQARSKFRIVVTLLYHSVMARIKFSHNCLCWWVFGLGQVRKRRRSNADHAETAEV